MCSTTQKRHVTSARSDSMYLTRLTDARKYQEGMATHISHLFCTKNGRTKSLMGMGSANRFLGSLKLYMLDNFSSGEPFINIHFGLSIWISYLMYAIC